MATSRNVGYFLRLFSSWALVFNLACAAGAKREERGGGEGRVRKRETRVQNTRERAHEQ